MRVLMSFKVIVEAFELDLVVRVDWFAVFTIMVLYVGEEKSYSS